MSKIYATADWHLSKRQYGIGYRETDFYNSALNIINNIIEQNSIILNAGDILDSNTPKSKALDTLFDINNTLKNKQCTLLYIEGNHDRTNPAWMDLLKYANNNDYGIKLLKDAEWFETKDANIIAFKEQPKSDLIENLNRINFLSNNKKNILMLHISCSDFTNITFGQNSLNIEQDISNLDKFDYIVIGDTHIHARKDFIKNQKHITALSPGSIEICSSTEDIDKFIYQIDLDKNIVDEVKLKTRKCFKYTITSNQQFDEFIKDLIAKINEDPIYYIKIDPIILDMSRVDAIIKDKNVIVKYTLLNTKNVYVSELEMDNVDNDEILDIKQFNIASKSAYANTLINDILGNIDTSCLKEQLKQIYLIK